MFKPSNLAISLALATAISVMPTAIADEAASPEAIPFTITFDGSYYPVGLDQIEYPYTAARLNQDGTCLLSIQVDDTGQMGSMSVVSCSNALFETAAREFIDEQPLSASLDTGLKTHALRVKWDIDVVEPTFTAQTLASVAH